MSDSEDKGQSISVSSGSDSEDQEKEVSEDEEYDIDEYEDDDYMEEEEDYDDNDNDPEEKVEERTRGMDEPVEGDKNISDIGESADKSRDFPDSARDNSDIPPLGEGDEETEKIRHQEKKQESEDKKLEEDTNSGEDHNDETMDEVGDNSANSLDNRVRVDYRIFRFEFEEVQPDAVADALRVLGGLPPVHNSGTGELPSIAEYEGAEEDSDDHEPNEEAVTDKPTNIEADSDDRESNEDAKTDEPINLEPDPDDHELNKEAETGEPTKMVGDDSAHPVENSGATDLPVVRVSHPEPDPDQLVLHYHGFAYVYQSVSHDKVCRALRILTGNTHDNEGVPDSPTDSDQVVFQYRGRTDLFESVSTIKVFEALEILIATVRNPSSTGEGAEVAEDSKVHDKETMDTEGHEPNQPKGQDDKNKPINITEDDLANPANTETSNHVVLSYHGLTYRFNSVSPDKAQEAMLVLREL